MIVVAALYRFTPVDDPADFRERIRDMAARHAIKGTMIVASEGLNGTVAGERDSLDEFLKFLRAWPGMEELEWKESFHEAPPFRRMRVKLKGEIVTTGMPDLDPSTEAGEYVAPGEWNRLISDPEVVLVDTRNDYEVALGTFRGAIDPKLASFREFPDWVKENLDPKKHRKVAMFCTGGIRCEKATAFMRRAGFEEVYHLHGGILKYLEETPRENSLWEGECFVFDGRVSVNHELKKGTYELEDLLPNGKGSKG